MKFNETAIASGSGFFWLNSERTYLVTNWHNVTGRNHITRDPIAKSAAVPNRIAIWGYRHLSAPDENGFFEMEYRPVELPLYDGDFEGPRWIEHPSFGHKVDIAAIDTTEVMTGFHITPVNTLESDARLDPSTSQDVFVVGFPFGRLQNAPAPIWKRGTVALDPSFDLEGLPKMLIDTATREGMSGSVVICRHIVVGGSYPKKNGSNSNPVLYSKLDVVAGIYSGRHYADLDRAQLGIVWKRSVIEELFGGPHVS